MPSNIKGIRQLPYNTILIQTYSQRSLCDMFLRFQEYYESPKFKGQIFTIGQIKNWYSIQYGADTYNRDWGGFNFPSTILDPFKQGLFDPLTNEEKVFLSLFKYRNDNFYIIGANDESTISHELSHALYWYSKQYKSQVDKICETFSKELLKSKKYLISKGYHKSVVNDEIQAYLNDHDDNYLKSNTQNKIISIFNKAYNEYSTSL
jgi:hypothetical protein